MAEFKFIESETISFLSIPLIKIYHKVQSLWIESGSKFLGWKSMNVKNSQSKLKTHWSDWIASLYWKTLGSSTLNRDDERWHGKEAFNGGFFLMKFKWFVNKAVDKFSEVNPLECWVHHTLYVISFDDQIKL